MEVIGVSVGIKIRISFCFLFEFCNGYGYLCFILSFFFKHLFPYLIISFYFILFFFSFTVNYSAVRVCILFSKLYHCVAHHGGCQVWRLFHTQNWMMSVKYSVHPGLYTRGAQNSVNYPASLEYPYNCPTTRKKAKKKKKKKEKDAIRK